MKKKSSMRRSSRIASLHGTEWSNLPSMKSQRKKATIHDRMEQNPVSVHHVYIPTRGICKITAEQLRYDTRQIQTFLDQVFSKDNPVDHGRGITHLFQYLYNNPCILFLHPTLMDIVVQKVKDHISEITNKENKLQEYFDAADRMSAALSYSQREIGNSILELGMKDKFEERDVWYDLKCVLMRLRDILPITKCSEPSACCPHSKKIENEKAT